MSIYAVGDLQGCHEGLLRLLEALRFDPAADQLWLVGDLVNRGGRSLEVLRELRRLGDAAVAVLGNHDLHLLARSLRAPEQRRRNADLDRVLAAPDAPELLGWLRRRPLLHVDRGRGFALVHAGIHPRWDLAEAEALALELGERLCADGWRRVLPELQGSGPSCWDPGLAGADRLRMICSVFTRMRYLDDAGCLDFEAKGPPGSQGPGLVPWFSWGGGASWPVTVLFGHWASLGFRREAGAIGLDSGYVWGGRLTAVCLDEDCRAVSVAAPAR